MVDRLTQLFQEWHRLGGAVLLAQSPPELVPRRAEEVIAESTAWCRVSGRLTWIALDWLIRHIDQLNTAELLRATQSTGDLSVLGVLCDAARERRPHPQFDVLIAACPPAPRVEVFFERVARNPLAAREAREKAVTVFRRWNYLSAELRYLTP